jgi:hypothetical protein
MKALATITVLAGVMAAPLAEAAPRQDDLDFDDEIRGWTLTGRIRVFPGDSGTITKADPSLGYTFNRHFQAYAGLPIYFVRESSLSSTAPTTMSGIGNAYAGLQFSLMNPVIDYSSSVEVTAPTGDESRGFSTGRVTADWTNMFSHTFGSVTPYASAGLANTISDTSFFVRPFSSDGRVGHFELGSFWALAPRISAGAAGYAVRASGEQRIVSRVLSDAANTSRNDTSGTSTDSLAPTATREPVFLTEVETIGLAEIANDEGFATWLTIRPQRNIDFQVGYNRSARYELDSIFFGVGFRVGK